MITAAGGGLMLMQTVTFTPGNASQGSSSLMASPTSLVADGVATTTLTVTAQDSLGNPVNNAPVTLGANGSANTFSAASGTTSAGTFTATLSSTKAETKVVTATVNGFMITTPVSFTPGAVDATKSTVVANPTTNVVANGAASSTITVTAMDANSNVISGAAVSLATPGATATPSSGTTDTSGVFSSKLTASSAGAKTVTATAAAVQLNAMPTVTFVACPSDVALSFGTTVTSGTTVGGNNLYHPACALPAPDAPEKTYSFTVPAGPAQAVIVDRSSSFAGAVTDLRPTASACSSDTQSFVCTPNRYIYCPNMASGTYELVIDGAGGATGSFGINVSAVAAKAPNSYGVVTTAPTFSEINANMMATKIMSETLLPNTGKITSATLPFDFRYFGTLYPSGTSLNVYQSGYVSFDATTVNTLTNVCIAPSGTASLPPNTIAPYWGKLASYQNNPYLGSIWALTSGTAPNRTLTIEWSDMDGWTGTKYECVQYSVQIVLHEDGQIEFQYKPTAENQCAGNTTDPNFAVGGHQTIGMQSNNGAAVVIEQASCATASGTGPSVVGTCSAGTCSANKGYLFVPRSAGCP
jgi:hypothetical protein